MVVQEFVCLINKVLGDADIDTLRIIVLKVTRVDIGLLPALPLCGQRTKFSWSLYLVPSLE